MKDINLQKDELKKVLVIDDGVAFRLMMKKIIEMYFYADVRLAQDPSEAFEMIADITPSLIILDMQMPIMDGFSALKKIRTTPASKDTPVIAFTALGDPALIAELIKLKISDYIKKPTTTEVIVAKLKPFLPLKRDII